MSGRPSPVQNAAGSVQARLAARNATLKACLKRRNDAAGVLGCHRQLCRSQAPAASGGAAAAGGSGAADFGSGQGKAGCTSFSSSSNGPAAAAGAATPVATLPTEQAGGIGGFWSLGRLQQQLQSLGLAGVVAYGIFNTLYYTCAFLFFWLYVAKVPVGQGMAATAKAFVTVMAGVWAGSQVTKAPRAAAALMLAPLVDRLMGWLQRTLGLKTRRGVFFVFLAGCITLALTLFGLVVLAWS